MITIGKIYPKDFAEALALCDLLGLGHGSIVPEKFWVAKDRGAIIGIANLDVSGDAFYLGAVGVVETRRNEGVATKLLNEIFASNSGKDVYLYTRIPDFFAHFGFKKTLAPSFIPSRAIYECDKCRHLSICFCLVRRTSAS